MRYSVNFNSETIKWTVIDNKRDCRVIGHFVTLEDARRAAWAEEEKWYKCASDDAVLKNQSA